MTPRGSRGDFLIGSALGASALGARGPEHAGPYDRAAIAAALAKPARHRQVFAIARIADGTPLANIRHGLDAYDVTYGEGPGAMHAAAVMYARGALLGLADEMWRAYRLAEAARRAGDVLTAQAASANPFSAQLAALAARGTSVFVCDRALADWSHTLASSGLADSPETLQATLRAHLVPGALLVPAGAAALNEAQEARFTFFQAS